MYGCGMGCLILIPFRLPQISCFTFSLECFSSDSDNCPDVGIRPLLQSPHLPRAGPVLLTLLFFPPYSFNLLKEINKFLHLIEFCVGLYILFCWSATPVHTQVVFRMHFCVWRCIPDISEERDVIHVHLLLRHLVFSWIDIFCTWSFRWNL